MLAAVTAALLAPAAFFCYGIWKEKYGPPMPISAGTSGIAFSPDERIVAVINPGLEVWNVADRAHPTLLNCSHGDDTVGGADPAFSPDGQLLASGSDSGTVVLQNITYPAVPVITATLHATIAAPRFPGMTPGPDIALAFSPGGRTLTAIAGNTTVTRWNVTNPGAVSRIATVTRLGVGEVAFGPDGRTVVGAPAVGDTLALWTLP